MSFEPDELLRTLCDHEVEFMVVGGVAAAMQGAPVLTQDLDVLYRIEESNLLRLKSALDHLDAVARDDPCRLRLGLSHLATRGHKLTSTRLGALDVLGSVNDEMTYDELLPWVDRLDLGGAVVQVLQLSKLIELKQRLGRPKDVAVLPTLLATLAERSKRTSP